MAEITVTPSEDSYEVSVVDGSTSTSHSVTVGSEDLERFGRGASAPDLIEASFRFLLSKEPKESIMSRFDISLIPTYFPDYESSIGDLL